MISNCLFLLLFIGRILESTSATPTTASRTSNQLQPTLAPLQPATNASNSGVYENDEVHCFTVDETSSPYLNDTDCSDLLNSLYVTLSPLLPQRIFVKGPVGAVNSFPVPADWTLRTCKVFIDSEIMPSEDLFRTYDVLRIAYEIFNDCIRPPTGKPLGGKAYVRARGFFVAITHAD